MFITAEEVEKYCFDHTTDEHPLYKELTEETYKTQNLPQMLSGKLSGAFMQLMIRLSSARNALEVGTFTGYMALKMAEAMPEDGRVFTLELDEQTASFAQKYFDQADWGKKITLMQGNALKAIERIEAKLDLTFIDADKINYTHYYEKALSLTRPGGLILIDNALWSGSVLDPKDESSLIIHQTNNLIQNDSRVINSLLPIRDGIMLAQKL